MPGKILGFKFRRCISTPTPPHGRCSNARMRAALMLHALRDVRAWGAATYTTSTRMRGGGCAHPCARRVHTALGSDQFHEGIGTSTVERLDRRLIRSTTRISTPSPVCTGNLRKQIFGLTHQIMIAEDIHAQGRAVNPQQRSIDSYMHRDLTQSRHLMTRAESVNGSK
ncbi:hypothetical protein F511_14312 [Dorcoceras hygrometricum]|uniref:Uncharacterized protein n=1 Tax=Dorcoceras hygrometricum TaxID=472368 RepID=A0A2Z7CYA2_9LAMI|nr:hypothetical protein F511_14312 [Dorcoceras hygrometricum]